MKGFTRELEEMLLGLFKSRTPLLIPLTADEFFLLNHSHLLMILMPAIMRFSSYDYERYI